MGLQAYQGVGWRAKEWEGQLILVLYGLREREPGLIQTREVLTRTPYPEQHYQAAALTKGLTNLDYPEQQTQSFDLPRSSNSPDIQGSGVWHNDCATSSNRGFFPFFYYDLCRDYNKGTQLFRLAYFFGLTVALKLAAAQHRNLRVPPFLLSEAMSPCYPLHRWQIRHIVLESPCRELYRSLGFAGSP